MKKMLLGAALAALCLPAQAQMGGNAAGTEAIKKIATDFVAAWNKDDAKALAALWAPDGDLINPWLRVAKGRAEVEKLFQDEHSTVMKSTTYEVKISGIRFLCGDAAIVDWDSTITGMKSPDGTAMPPLVHHVTSVVEQKDGKWLVVAARPVVTPGPPPSK